MSFRRLPATIAASVALVCLFLSGSRAWAESGITNVINGATNNVAGNYMVGTNGAFNALIITNAGTLNVTGGGVINGVIGNSAISTNNYVLVVGPGSLWSNSSDLTVGNTGSWNQLIISSGGQVLSGVGWIGYAPGASNNSVLVSGAGSLWKNRGMCVGKSGPGNSMTIADGGSVYAWNCSISDTSAARCAVLVTGTGSVWTLDSAHNGNLTVGWASPYQSLTISNGGHVTSGWAAIGRFSNSSNNSVVVTGGGSLWTIDSGGIEDKGLHVGYAGAGNSLLIANGGQVTSTESFYIGDVGPSSNNSVLVTGGGSLWSNSANLYVGRSGSSNSLTIANGGRVMNGTGYIGDASSANSNSVLVSGGGSRWDSRGDLYVGSQGNGNRLTINNGGVVSNLNASIGNYAATGTQNSNTVLVDGPGSTWIIAGTVPISRCGTGNGLTIRNGGRVTVATSVGVGTEAEGDNNFLTIDGAGSLLDIGATLEFGGFGSGNKLVITNGGALLSSFGQVGYEGLGNNNAAIVTGSGSLWSNSSLVIGAFGSGNSLTLADGGTVTASTLLVGSNSPSGGNSITVSSGNLFVTNATASGLLDVRRGSLNLNSGTVTTDRITGTNGASSVLNFNGGTLNSRGSTINNGAQFRVGNGVSAATMHLAGGNHSFANGLLINTNATLSGTGAITGAITDTGTIAPGDSAGILTGSSDLTLLDTALLLMELAGTDLSLYDQLNLAGLLNFDGTLTVSALNGFQPEAGDQFNLFDFSASSGAFDQINLPALAPTLYWNTDLLYNNGEIFVDAGTGGYLQVTITPQAAIAGGAQWRVDSGPWRDSGEVAANLSAGNHTLEFKAVMGWTTPSNQTVTIIVKQGTATSGAYTEILSPANGTTFTSTSVTFRWSGPGWISQYALWVGTTPGSWNLYAGIETGRSRTLTLPADGRPIYVVLWSWINGAWQQTASNTYTAATAMKAQMVSPANGTTLAGASTTFTWDAGVGATLYGLWVGSAPLSYDIYYIPGNQTGTSRTVTTLPADGRTLYVTLRSFINGAWQSNSYTYTAYTAVKAKMLSPSDGTTLAGASTTFTWDAGVGVTQYGLWVGSAPLGYDIYYIPGNQTGLSRTVTLPVDGRKLYVTLRSFINGAWQSNSYTYTAYTAPPPVKANMLSPTGGTTLAGVSTTFTWEDVLGVALYGLWVGNAPNGYDIYYIPGNQTGTSRTVALPTDGRALYVTLRSLINGTWYANPYTYTAYTAPPSAIAKMLTPADGATLTGPTTTFTWDAGVGVTLYGLWVDNAPLGYDIYYIPGNTTALSRTVTLPTDGRTLYVTLRSLINGMWQSNSYSYPACPPAKAQMLSPAGGATLVGGSATFIWDTGLGVTQYALWVGNAPSGNDIYSGVETGQSRKLTTLPTDGRTVYVTLWSLINGAWQSNSYSYICTSGPAPAPAKAQMLKPADGATLTSGSVTFIWDAGVGATQYGLWVGNAPSGYDIYYIPGNTTALSRTVTVPMDGRTLYVTLWSLVNGTWQSNAYTYKAFGP